MALKPNRKCIICAEKYSYCMNCRDSRPAETWRNVYDNAECKDVADAWYAYRGHEISKADAKKLIERHPSVLEKVFKLDSIPAKEIKAICDFVEDVKEEEVQVTEDKVEETVDDQIEQPQVENKEAEVISDNVNENRQFRNNYKNKKK